MHDMLCSSSLLLSIINASYFITFGMSRFQKSNWKESSENDLRSKKIQHLRPACPKEGNTEV